MMINGDNRQPRAFHCGAIRTCVPLALGILFVLGGVFLTLAAYRILPHHVNPISTLSGGNSIGPVTAAVGGLLLAYFIYQQVRVRRVVFEDEYPLVISVEHSMPVQKAVTRDALNLVQAKDICSILAQLVHIDEGIIAERQHVRAVYRLIEGGIRGRYDCGASECLIIGGIDGEGGYRVRDADEAGHDDWLSTVECPCRPVTLKHMIDEATEETHAIIFDYFWGTREQHEVAQTHEIVQDLEKVTACVQERDLFSDLSIPAGIYDSFKEYIIAQQYYPDDLFDSEKISRICAYAALASLNRGLDKRLWMHFQPFRKQGTDVIDATVPSLDREIIHRNFEFVRNRVDEPIDEASPLWRMAALVEERYYNNFMLEYLRLYPATAPLFGDKRYANVGGRLQRALEQRFDIVEYHPSAEQLRADFDRWGASCALVAVCHAIYPGYKERDLDRFTRAVTMMRTELCNELEHGRQKYLKHFEYNDHNKRTHGSPEAYYQWEITQLREITGWVLESHLPALAKVIKRALIIYSNYTNDFAVDFSTGEVIPQAVFGSDAYQEGPPIHLFLEDGHFYLLKEKHL